jgi:hypothetical protein
VDAIVNLQTMTVARKHQNRATQKKKTTSILLLSATSISNLNHQLQSLPLYTLDTLRLSWPSVGRVSEKK